MKNKTYEKITDFEHSNIPTRYREQPIRVPNEDAEAFAQLKNIKANIESWAQQGCSLLLWSSKPGNGKTTVAINLLETYAEDFYVKYPRALRGRVKPVVFINVPEFLNLKKAAISSSISAMDFNDIQNKVDQAQLLVLDDIGVKNSTDYELDVLYAIINKRINDNMPTIYTSNLSPADLQKVLGERLSDRIVSYSDVIEFRAPSGRKSNFQTPMTNSPVITLTQNDKYLKAWNNLKEFKILKNSKNYLHSEELRQLFIDEKVDIFKDYTTDNIMELVEVVGKEIFDDWVNAYNL